MLMATGSSSARCWTIPVELPMMNIDIHSLSQQEPAKSYVLINMQRYRNGDRTAEGLLPQAEDEPYCAA